MARPERNTVDYFPFYCEDGKKMFYLEETYGNDGFATFVKILRELAKTEYHYLDLSKTTTMMFLSAKCKINIETLESIIKDLVNLEKFDSVLWNENKIIWCQDFVDSIQDAYSKRKNNCITYNSLLLLLRSLGVRKQDKSSIKLSKSESKGVINPQRKEKETKEDNNNGDEPPTQTLSFENEDAFLHWFNQAKCFYYKTKTSNFRLLPSLTKKTFKTLNKTYSLEEFSKAIKRMSENEYVRQNNLFTPEHFLRVANFEKYLNTEKFIPRIVNNQPLN